MDSCQFGNGHAPLLTTCHAWARAPRLMLAMVCFTMHVSDALVPSDLSFVARKCGASKSFHMFLKKMRSGQNDAMHKLGKSPIGCQDFSTPRGITIRISV